MSNQKELEATLKALLEPLKARGWKLGDAIYHPLPHGAGSPLWEVRVGRNNWEKSFVGFGATLKEAVMAIEAAVVGDS